MRGITTVGIEGNMKNGGSLNEKIRQAFVESYERSAELIASGESDPVANRNEVIAEMSEKISQAIDDYIKSITVTVVVPSGIPVTVGGATGTTTTAKEASSG